MDGGFCAGIAQISRNCVNLRHFGAKSAKNPAWDAKFVSLRAAFAPIGRTAMENRGMCSRSGQLVARIRTNCDWIGALMAVLARK